MSQDQKAEAQASLCPSGCGCLCHDIDDDTNIEGGCEKCSKVHEDNVKRHKGGRVCRYCRIKESRPASAAPAKRGR